MKAFLIVLTLLLGWATTRAQDAPFEFQSPFGSDGTNQPGLDPQSRNYLVLEHAWDAYIDARKQLTQPLPKAHPGGYSQAQIDHWMTSGRYSELLESMAELRAFTNQNKGYMDEIQKAEVARIDHVLRALDLRYYQGSDRYMFLFCEKMGPNKIRQFLANVLSNDDGTPRPIPPTEFGFH
jgi:hypothetical protein